MCGRFDFHGTTQDLTAAFGDLDAPDGPLDVAAHYNIAPTQPALVLRHTAAGRLAPAPMVFGWKRPDGKGLWLNARSETVAQQPAFRHAFAAQRCLVPANGFYEWQPQGGKKQPYYFRPRGGGLLALAAIWRALPENPPGANAAGAFLILTCAPNPLMRPIHNRMPVVLPPNEARAYLDPQLPPTILASMLGPVSNDWLTMHPVSPQVNNARHDAPDCIAPV